MTDNGWMAQTLALAVLGEGTASPNPLVGCVVVKGDAVVGRGFHRGAGEPHAEALALSEAGADAAGATLYVNLEPCAHQGRTAPCAEAIVRARIARVVAAISDPNPVVDGRGFLALRNAGIVVTTGVLAAEARAVNGPFLSTHERRRPFVTLKAAQSLDGRIAASGGSTTWITGTAARRYAHRLRFRHDAVLAGAGTIRADDPLLTVRLSGVTASRLRVVLAPTLGVSPLANVFLRERPDAKRPRVYVASDCDETEIARFGDAADIIRVATNTFGLDLPGVLADLVNVGVESILVEGGGATSGAFLCQGLVDEVVLFIAHSLLGANDATPVVALPAAAKPGSGWRVAGATVVPLGRDLVLVGRPEAV